MPTKIVDVTGTKEAKDLPDTQKIFNVKYTDPTTGITLGGHFTVERLNLGKIRQVSLLRAELNGGMPKDSLDRNTIYLNSIAAHLQIALIKVPDWWKPDEFYDGSIMIEVYEEVTSFEDSFRLPAPRQSQGAKGDSQKPDEQPGLPDAPVVDEEVQAAPDVG